MTPSTLRVATAANPPGTARATPREYEFRSTSAVAAHEQRNCRSSDKVLNLKIVLDWFSGAISPMAKCWTTNAGHARCCRRLATVSGSSEGVAPEGTPQRLCPHPSVLSQNDGWPTAKSTTT